MESERQSISRAGERPVTRWRREPEHNDKVQSPESPESALSRSYSKMERPTSRRGIKTDMTEFGISRPSTSGKNGLSRPPSGSIISGRAPTPASRMSSMTPNSRMSAMTSASRMSAMTSSSRMSPMTPVIMPRASSGLARNYIQPNAKVLDRPVTQQGLAGIPTSSSKNIPKLAKQIQDKRYYQQILEQKIRELNQEIESISHHVEKQNNGNILYLDSNQKTKDSVNELKKLEGQLIDYRMSFEKIVSGINKEEILKEARELKEFTDQEEIEMEVILQKRHVVETKLNELNTEIESKKQMMGNMNFEIGSKHNIFLEEINKLQKEMNILQEQEDQLSDEKFKMQEKITSSPIKQEAYKLYVKIFETEKKRDKLLEEEKNSTALDNKEKLYEKDNQENFNANAAKQQIIDIKKKIANAQQELQQLENSTDEIQSEKSSKSNDSDKQEIMEIFKTSFERTKSAELEKLSQLEEEIVEHLEQISNTLTEGIDADILTDDEMDMLKSLMDQNSDNKHKKSFEKLKQDSKKLRQILNKLKSLESKIITDTSQNNDQKKNRQILINNLKRYNNDKESVMNDDELINETEAEYRSKMNEHYSKLKQKFEENEIYRLISILEDKLLRVSFDDEETLKFIKEQNELDKSDQESLMERLLSLRTRYNNFLIKEMKKSVY